MPQVTLIGLADERDGTGAFDFGGGVILQVGKSANLTAAQINSARGQAVFASGDVSTAITIKDQSPGKFDFRTRLRGQTFTPA